MMLTVTQEAAAWLCKELSLNKGDCLRFYAMLYGNAASIHPNFSLGLSKESPSRIGIQTELDGITYYFEESDRWYLDGHRLTVKVVQDELEYEFAAVG
jgi:uncharacterized protein YneR